MEVDDATVFTDDCEAIDGERFRCEGVNKDSRARRSVVVGSIDLVKDGFRHSACFPRADPNPSANRLKRFLFL